MARVKTHGPWQQVSRLGNPLINEVVIPTTKKDYWNSQKPDKDSQFAKYYEAPELTAVANVLYPALDDASTIEPRRPRRDPAHRAGHPAIGGRPDRSALHGDRPTKADMLRVNTGIKPNAGGRLRLR